jgi:hypothetical protein
MALTLATGQAAIAVTGKNHAGNKSTPKELLSDLMTALLPNLADFQRLKGPPMTKTIMSTMLLFALLVGISFQADAQRRIPRVVGNQGAQTNSINFGTTTVALSSDLAEALTALGVGANATSPGTLRVGVAQFPITTGVFDSDNLRFEFMHSGGLSLTAGDVNVELLHFTIDGLTDAPVLTGIVAANGTVVGRIPLFKLNPTEAPSTTQIFLQIPGVQLTLTKEAADALNGAFNIAAFVEDFPIGTATVLANPSRVAG